MPAQVFIVIGSVAVGKFTVLQKLVTSNPRFVIRHEGFLGANTDIDSYLHLLYTSLANDAPPSADTAAFLIRFQESVVDQHFSTSIEHTNCLADSLDSTHVVLVERTALCTSIFKEACREMNAHFGEIFPAAAADSAPVQKINHVKGVVYLRCSDAVGLKSRVANRARRGEDVYSTGQFSEIFQRNYDRLAMSLYRRVYG